MLGLDVAPTLPIAERLTSTADFESVRERLEKVRDEGGRMLMSLPVFLTLQQHLFAGYRNHQHLAQQEIDWFDWGQGRVFISFTWGFEIGDLDDRHALPRTLRRLNRTDPGRRIVQLNDLVIVTLTATDWLTDGFHFKDLIERTPPPNPASDIHDVGGYLTLRLDVPPYLLLF